MATRTSSKTAAQSAAGQQVSGLLARLESRGKRRIREEMASRYGIHVEKAFGVAMADIKRLARHLGRDHDLAGALWATGWYEARLLAAMVDEPGSVTVAQMDRWCRDFDNWAICDTVCFHLFDRAPDAWSRVGPWAAKKGEFQRRAAFALLWALALHDKEAPDERFLAGLDCIERVATDQRNFVKKAVNMALRALGRRSPAVRAAAVDVARRLADSGDAAASWNGRLALKEFVARGVAKARPSGRS
ncbi:MAG: DNA alkylation repair protein [Thermoanaerobaculia bacterium]